MNHCIRCTLAVCLALSLATAQEIIPGEQIATEWLRQSGVDGTFKTGENPVLGDPAGGGNSRLVDLEDGMAFSENHWLPPFRQICLISKRSDKEKNYLGLVNVAI